MGKRAQWEVCASARDPSGNSAVAQDEPRWNHPGQLRR